MNSCILMAKIVRSPELRYTQDQQTPIAEMVVEFEGPRPEDPPSTLKVVGWRNLASEIQEKYSEGDRVILEGRLSMNTVERPEGFKEKRAELVVSRIHLLESNPDYSSTSTATANKIAPMDSYQSMEPTLESTDSAILEKAATSPKTTPTPIEQNLDDIPF